MCMIDTKNIEISNCTWPLFNSNVKCTLIHCTCELRS